MTTVLLSLGLGVVTLLLFTSLWYLYKFAKIIMILEDDFGPAADTLQEVEDALNGVLELKLFFDDEQLQVVVSKCMENIKLAKHRVSLLIKKLTDRSKQKYIMILEEEPPPEPPTSEQQLAQHFAQQIPAQQMALQGVPEYGPNRPRSIIQGEGGTIAHVGKSNRS